MKLCLSEFMVKLFLVYGWVNYTVHEYSHLLMTRLLGHYGEIRSTALNKMYPVFNYHIPQWHRWLIYGAGGFGVFITFTVLAWRNKCPEAVENNTSYRLVAIANLIYGFFEAFYPQTFWEFGGLVGLITAFTYLVYMLLFKATEITL